MIQGMQLRISDRTLESQRCPKCGEVYDLVTGFIVDQTRVWAGYRAMCHGHPAHAAWIDVILGELLEVNADSNLTFACELRSDGAMALDAPQTIANVPSVWGRQLSREEALGHPSVAVFWRMVDVISEGDNSVRAHVYGDVRTAPHRHGLISRLRARFCRP
ncbi:MAG: hypothetical protein L0227_09740 [Chloroflexi bacterium]|nr:hypothetical protein [Chloroflexota bacterium]